MFEYRQLVPRGYTVNTMLQKKNDDNDSDGDNSDDDCDGDGGGDGDDAG